MCKLKAVKSVVNKFLSGVCCRKNKFLWLVASNIRLAKENKFMRCRQFVVQKFQAQLLTLERVMKIRVMWFFGAVNFFSLYFLALRGLNRGKNRLLAFNLAKFSKEKKL